MNANQLIKTLLKDLKQLENWQNTLRKTSETGPSFSEAANSCLTFSNPLIIACISSAKDFNCICKKSHFRHYLTTIPKIDIPTKISKQQKKERHRKKMHLSCGFQADKVLIKIKKSRRFRSKTLRHKKTKPELQTMMIVFTKSSKVSISWRNLYAETPGELCTNTWWTNTNHASSNGSIAPISSDNNAKKAP